MGQDTVTLAKEKLEYQIDKIDRTLPFIASGSWMFSPLKTRAVEPELCDIARLFQFIDKEFAQYFKSTISQRMAREDLDYRLKSAREAVGRIQDEQIEPDTPARVILGDLGKFFEAVCNGDDTAIFKCTDSSVKARLYYLQDAYLDVPYWQLVLDFLADQENNSMGSQPELIIRVLSHVKLDVLCRRAKLLEHANEALAGGLCADLDSLGPLLSGIDARLESLGNIWHRDALYIERDPLFRTLIQQMYPADIEREREVSQLSAAEPEAEASKSSPMIDVSTADNTQQIISKELAIILGLFALIVLPSLVFGMIAFNISRNAKEPGTYQDADFWNLLQGTVLSSFGSLSLAISFLLRDAKRIKHWSTVHTVACVLWGLSLVWGIVSVAIYTNFNTAWSSAAATLSSLLAMLTPLVLMLATPGETIRKAKQD